MEELKQCKYPKLGGGERSGGSANELNPHLY